MLKARLTQYRLGEACWRRCRRRSGKELIRIVVELDDLRNHNDGIAEDNGVQDRREDRVLEEVAEHLAHARLLLLGLLHFVLHPLLKALVEVHHGNVAAIHEEEHDGLPDGDLQVVRHKEDNHGQRKAVVRRIARERPPRELEVWRDKRAAGDDEEYVEDGADDSTKADVRPRDEDANDRRRQLGESCPPPSRWHRQHRPSVLRPQMADRRTRRTSRTRWRGQGT